VWLFGDPGANHAVDITEQVDRKLRALAAHESQLPEPAVMETRLRERLEVVGQQFGLPAGHSAEAFRVVDTG
jgi:LmbE family N-acetylglucosaminyl deacetylase